MSADARRASASPSCACACQTLPGFTVGPAALGALEAGQRVGRTPRQQLNDLGIETERPVEASVWTNEEGSRFAPAMVGSGVNAGVITLDDGLSRADAEGKTMGEERSRIGCAGTEAMGGRAMHAFFETHIEQGPIL